MMDGVSGGGQSMLNVPSNFEGRGCHGGELGGNGEDAVEFSVRERLGYFSRDTGEYSSRKALAVRCIELRCNAVIPCLAQLHVRNAKVIAKQELKVAENIESATIDADVLSQSLKNESPLVDGRFSFSRHDCAL